MKQQIGLVACIIVLGFSGTTWGEDVCPAVAAPTCPADVNGNDTVNTTDLFEVLGGWGTDQPDVTGDGLVDCHDEFVVLGNWGDCDPEPADVNGDGEVDFKDISVILENCDADCRGDLDRNRVIDQRDVDTWLCLEQTGNPAADIDGSGTVTIDDLSRLLAALSDPPNCSYDISGDGKIGWSDIIIIVDNGDKLH